MKKIVWTYGLISAGIIALIMNGMMIYMAQKQPGSIDFENGMAIGYLTFLIGFSLIYFAQARYRDTVGGGRISFGRALGIGMLITLIACVVYSIMWLIVYYNVYPDFFDQYQAYELEKMKQAGKSADEINKAVQSMADMKEMAKNPVLHGLMTMMEPLPVGIIVSLIAALIVSYKKKPFKVAGA